MIRSLMIALAVACLFANSFAAPTTAPSADVTAAAKDVLSATSDAYTKLKSLTLTGTITGDFDVDGQKNTQSSRFTTTYSAPNKFRHETPDEGLLGSTGQQLYVYAKGRNAYLSVDAPKAKVTSDQLPDPFAQLLSAQNLSLAMALSSEPAAELTRGYAKIDIAADVTVGDKPFTALKLTAKEGSAATTLLIDPATHLLRRATMDLTSQLLARGAHDVTKALLTIDYTDVKPNAPTQPDQFAWTPPATAKDAADAGGDDDDAATKELTGKPAPSFKLKDLEDKEISLADLKGKVIVLDFWATWCGPCVASLPHIDKLHQDFKEQGVKVFAVNQGEEKDLVQGFIKSKNFTLPVLLDSDSKVGQSYKANAIPETVVIGKDGTIRKVFVGAGPDTESRLREAVQAALKAS